MTIDKEFVTTLIAIVGATAAIMARMGKLVTKEDMEKLTKRVNDLDIKLSEKIDKLTENKADISIAKKA